MKYIPIFILAFAFLACGNNNAQEKQSSSTTSTTTAQKEREADYAQMVQIMKKLADQAGSDLADCCSSFGYNHLSTYVYEDECSYNDVAKSLKIKMKVSWKGGITGRSYWIKGYLFVDIDTGKRRWQKIDDSGGFSPGCSRGCIN